MAAGTSMAEPEPGLNTVAVVTLIGLAVTIIVDAISRVAIAHVWRYGSLMARVFHSTLCPNSYPHTGSQYGLRSINPSGGVHPLKAWSYFSAGDSSPLFQRTLMLSSYVAQYGRPDFLLGTSRCRERVEFGHEFNTAEASGLVGAIQRSFSARVCPGSSSSGTQPGSQGHQLCRVRSYVE